jgi:esterase/lipase superfamily enzyme
MAEAHEVFEKKAHYPIPVVWSTGKLTPFSYFRDRSVSSLKAGRVLNNLIRSFGNDIFIEKSLMMHSMGNHVVLNGVLGLNKEVPTVRFDNIFMVAAVSNTSISSNELSLCRVFCFFPPI